ncbi:MAG TPA: ATP-binding protein [Pseudolabrys sp.]|nr:ATP-binding protein [Pseudolabrys sp.]
MAKRKARTARPARKARAKRRANATAAPARAIELALAGLAHDMRTALTGTLALAELLTTSDLGERERGWANAIKAGAEHLAAMTTLIVDAAKAERAGITLQRETFPLRRLVDTVARAMAARAEAKGIKAEVAVGDDLPGMVTGDPLRLRAALENLADNAVKFTDKGSVGFAVRTERAARGRVRLVFEVSDSGIGMSKAELARLFRPFAQASESIARRYGGSGLGLVFVKRLAKAMGGDLTVNSAPGRGSTFRLAVPVERADADHAATAPNHDARAAQTRSLAILCAEDNPYGRVVMNTILTELGHRVDFVETGEAAIKAAARGGYDAVLMDVTLSGLNGVEAARRIRALDGHAGRVPIIGISGRTEVGDEAAARAAGMDFYFTKPVAPSQLVQALSAVSVKS